MRDAAAAKKIDAYRRQIARLRERIRKAQAGAAAEVVADYALTRADGAVKLSALFGGKRELFVIHNMGAACAYCTLWADGSNGIYHHLADRAAFVVSSPDPPAAQAKLARGRGWRFPMASHRGTSFAADMGYQAKDGGLLPGVSVFRRQRGRIIRIADTGFSPGDDFCTMWHFLDLLPGGARGWGPKLRYG